MPERKLISDFPINRWLDAAGKCQYCEAPYMVMFTFIDPDNSVGDVEIKCQHKDDCMEDFGEYQEGDRLQHYDDMAGWEWSNRYLIWNDIKYFGFASVLNKAPCAECGKMVCDIPLIVWSQDRAMEVHFCMPCAKRIGILEHILKQKK